MSTVIVEGQKPAAGPHRREEKATTLFTDLGQRRWIQPKRTAAADRGRTATAWRWV